MSGTRPIALVTPANLGPCHGVRYRALAKRLNLAVVKIPVREHARPWSPPGGGFAVYDPFRDTCGRPCITLRELLGRIEARATVFVGYNSRFITAGALASKSLGIPRILYLVGFRPQLRTRRGRELVKRTFCRFAFDGVIATGRRAARYGEQLTKKGPIPIVGNVVDNDHFQRPCAQSRDREGTPHFLVVARLSHEKALDVVLAAFKKYRADGGEWNLVVAGEGPEGQRLRETGASLGVPVTWLSWVGYDELPALYWRAGSFLLASRFEPWGLAVNEAMAAGLPVMVSSECGCVDELVSSRNGIVFPPDDVLSLARAMKDMSSRDHDARDEMGKASAEAMQAFTVEKWADRFAGAVESIVQRSLR